SRLDPLAVVARLPCADPPGRQAGRDGPGHHRRARRRRPGPRGDGGGHAVPAGNPAVAGPRLRPAAPGRAAGAHRPGRRHAERPAARTGSGRSRRAPGRRPLPAPEIGSGATIGIFDPRRPPGAPLLATGRDMPLPSHAKIVEVSPRDGLQNEKTLIATDIKVELVDRLTAAGFPNIEARSEEHTSELQSRENL